MEQRSEVYKALVLLKATRGQQAAACTGAAALGSVLGQRALGSLGGQPRCILPKRCSPLVVTHQALRKRQSPLSARGPPRHFRGGRVPLKDRVTTASNNACAKNSRVGLLGRLAFCGQALSLMPGDWQGCMSPQCKHPHPPNDTYILSPFILFLFSSYCGNS
jgi:hypothetical protein